MGSVFILLAAIGSKSANAMTSAMRFEMLYQARMIESKLLMEEEKGKNRVPKDLLPKLHPVDRIQELYDYLYDKGINSQKDALEVGCMVEVTDINDLNEYIKEAEESNAQDVQDAFEFLRSGSYNHYWAFDNGLKNIGISDGCCSLGDEYCHLEYPK